MCRAIIDSLHVDKTCIRLGTENWRWKICPAARLLCEYRIPCLGAAVLIFMDWGVTLVLTEECLDHYLVPQSSTCLNQRC